MGFITTANTLTLTAKLTPLGRQKLISTNNGLITSFSLGDSDANYYASIPLTTGQVPAEAGDYGAGASASNSTAQIASIKSPLIYNASGVLRKPVENQSLIVSVETVNNGLTSVSGTNLTFSTINRNNNTTDSLVNLFYSFGLPLNSTQDYTYTGTTYANGGFADTALSGLAQTNILVIGIKNSTYGECLDGKAIKIELPTSAGTYTIYSTFQKTTTATNVQDANIRDTASTTAKIGDNIAMLFSDDIVKPNGGSASLSWGTGFGTTKPFSVNKKQFYNFQTSSNLGLTADTIVGVAYLDKGLLVITHPTIVNNYTSSLAATSALVTFDSVSTSVFQNITCIAGRGEFGGSTNSTFSGSDVPRISELGLYDNMGNLIAVAKTDRHVTKNINEFKAFNVKITL
jgi:hypothetical protein